MDSMNRLLEKKARQRGVPLHGMFELTPLCNLDCKMCYVHLTHEQMGDRRLLSTQQWQLLMEQAIQCGMIDATLTGGECLTYPGFDELYLYLQSKGIRISVLTNGLLLDEKRIDFFKKHPVNVLQVTIYGTDNEGYERVTGKRVFDLVIGNVKLAKAAGIPVKVGVTSSKYMGTDDEKVFGYLSELGINVSMNSRLFEARNETGRHLAEYDQTDEDYIRLRKKYIQQRGIVVSEECGDLAVEMPCVLGIKCGGGNSGFSVDWQGNLYACSMLRDICEDPFRKGFASAWEKVHEAARQYPNPIECVNCAYQALCTKCVAAHRDGALPGHANPKICERTKLMLQCIQAERNRQ